MAAAVQDKTKNAVTEGGITVYNFSAQTSKYTGLIEEYLAIGVGLSSYSTDVDPDDYEMVLSGQEWTQQEDHRCKTVWSTADIYQGRLIACLPHAMSQANLI